MAEKNLIRRIVAVFDRDSARRAENELAASLEKAGVKGGEGFIRELRKQFDLRMADLKVALARGVIDEKEFRKQADAAAKQFNDGLVKGLEGARRAGTLAEGEYIKLSKQIKRVSVEGESTFARLTAAAGRFAAGLAAAFTVRAIIDFGRDAVKAAIEAERAWAELRSTIEATGLAFATVEPQLRAAADQFERTTIYDDDAFATTLQRLVALTGDYSASLDNVGLVADVAARFFKGELAPAADLVGKAMMGNTRGLKQLGIESKDAQAALDELAARSFGGAANAADSLDGKVRQLGNAWDNFREAVGDALLKAGGGTGIFDTLTAVIRTMTEFITENGAGLRVLGGVFTWLFVHVIARLQAVILLPLIGQLAALVKIYAAMGSVAGFVGKVFGANTKEIDEHARKAHELADALGRITAATAKTAVFGLQIPDAPSGGPAARAPRPRPRVAAPGSKGTIPDPDADTGAGTDIPAPIPEVVPEPDLTPVIEAHEEAAEEVSSAWIRAGQAIGIENEKALGTIAALGQAWQQGGLAGIAQLAKAKVKENLARVIEESAKALGALWSNPAAAATHAKSAAGHAAAAVAWKQLGGSIGGASPAGAGGGGGSLASGAATGLDKGGSVEPRGTEVHIYMDPLDPKHPRVQSFVHETNQEITQRYGANAHVTWHPRSSGRGS